MSAPICLKLPVPFEFMNDKKKVALLNTKKKLKKISIPEQDKSTLLIINILMTYNNTTAAICNAKDIVLKVINAGVLGFKKSKRGSSYAEEMVIRNCIKYCTMRNCSQAILKISGIKSLSPSLVKLWDKVPFDVIEIINNTKHPHNGCRLPSKRRV